MHEFLSVSSVYMMKLILAKRISLEPLEDKSKLFWWFPKIHLVFFCLFLLKSTRLHRESPGSLKNKESMTGTKLWRYALLEQRTKQFQDYTKLAQIHQWIQQGHVHVCFSLSLWITFSSIFLAFYFKYFNTSPHLTYKISKKTKNSEIFGIKSLSVNTASRRGKNYTLHVPTSLYNCIISFNVEYDWVFISSGPINESNQFADIGSHQLPV